MWARGLFAVALLASPNLASADEPQVELLMVGSGDEDGDGIADRDDDELSGITALIEVKLPSKRPASLINPIEDAALSLFDGSKRALRGPLARAVGPFHIQAREPGRHDVEIFGTKHRIGGVLVSAIDGRGRFVDLATSHASIERTPPRAALADPTQPDDDPDSLRFVVTADASDLPTSLSFVSSQTVVDGNHSQAPSSMVALDSLRSVPLTEAACPSTTRPGLVCATTPPIRAVMDDLDRQHPLSVARSIKVELGGVLAIGLGDRPSQMFLRVGGPRDSAVGPIDRFRAKVRVRLIRLDKAGPPPVGESDGDAIEHVRDEIDRASMIWGACGVSFGPRGSADVKIVDPPPSHLLAVGCEAGAPASGGTIRFDADGKTVEVEVGPGTTPAGAARLVAKAVERIGLRAVVSDNAAIIASTYPTTDVLVRRPNGELVVLSVPKASAKAVGERPVGARVSTDATLEVCIGRVDLNDGLSHFTDANAIAGTLEERTLIKAFDDGDPSTIDVYVVPSFGGDSRIGESFIFADGGAIKDVVVEDRAGFRADRASFTLAHEVGHVLLDQPGHPDDFGVDTPTRLMDADAVNASAFGPRRLSIAECERVVRQSGPRSPARLLAPWPIQQKASAKPRK